jgi:zinc protease
MYFSPIVHIFKDKFGFNLRLKTFFFIFVLVTGFFTGIDSKASDLGISLDVEKYTLSNGMKVLLHVDKRIPMVSVNQWYDVGSFHEDRERTGLAHFFEHLMFKGTKKFPNGQFDKIVSKVGGQNNAFTTRDYTGYYEIVPTSSLKKILELESDRMVNLNFIESQIQSEREVVKEERRMRTENSPTGYIFEIMMQASFKGHPYDSPVIGSMEHLNKTTLEDFKSFYKKFYAPNNSTLILVGDFDKKKVKSWIQNFYGKIPASKIDKVNSPEIKSIKSRNLIVEPKKFDQRKVSIYFQAPAMGEKESYALDVLCEILAGDEASPLYKTLVEDTKIATSTNLWNYSLKHAGVISFNTDLLGRRPFNEVESLFYSTVYQLTDRGISQDQLERAKNKISYDYVQALKTLGGKARVLAQSELVRGDYKSFFEDLKVYQSISDKEVLSVAKKYLVKNKSNVLYLGK